MASFSTATAKAYIPKPQQQYQLHFSRFGFSSPPRSVVLPSLPRSSSLLSFTSSSSSNAPVEKRNDGSTSCAAVRHMVGSVVSAQGLRFAIVVARFNEVVTKLLLEGVLETFKRYSVREEDVDVVWVPGSFEIPLVAERLGKMRKYDAVLCIGAVDMAGGRDTRSGDANGSNIGNGTGVVIGAGLMTQLLQTIQAQIQARVPPQVPEEELFMRRNKSFKQLGGVSFKGNGNALDAVHWLQKCNSVFRKMGPLTQVERQELATQQLEGVALDWWEPIREALGDAELTWDAFEDSFMMRFVPAAERH